MNALKTTLAIAVLAAALPAGAQSVYRCTDASGQTVYSDLICNNLNSVEKVNVQPNTMDTSRVREQMLRQEVTELRGQNAALEQELRMPVTGRTRADLQGERAGSYACNEARRSYEHEASVPSRKDNLEPLEARRLAMYSACGMFEQERRQVNIKTTNIYGGGRGQYQRPQTGR